MCVFLTCSVDENAGRASLLLFNVLQVVFGLVHSAAEQQITSLIIFSKRKRLRIQVKRYKRVCAYVRKSLTSSTVISPVESRVRSAQLRGESSGVSRMGEDRLLGGSSVCPAREKPTECYYSSGDPYIITCTILCLQGSYAFPKVKFKNLSNIFKVHFKLFQQLTAVDHTVQTGSKNVSPVMSD